MAAGQTFKQSLEALISARKRNMQDYLFYKRSPTESFRVEKINYKNLGQ